MSEVQLNIPKEQIRHNITVEFTTDLYKFKTLKGNRTHNYKHIKKLVKSIEKVGMLCNPVIVNELYEIIDGQHRIEAAKLCGEGVYYIVVPGYRLEHIHTLNINQKNWSNKQFLEGYTKIGGEDYQSYVTLTQFCEKWPNFKLTDSIRLCSINGGDNTKTNLFKHGLWEHGDMELAEKYAEKITKIGNYFENYNKCGFVNVMIKLHEHEKFSIDEFIEKVELQPTLLQECANLEQWLILIERIYNYKRPKARRLNLRFY